MKRPVSIVESVSLNAENSAIKDFLLLIKFRLSFVVVLSSVLAFLLATPAVSSIALLVLFFGGFFVTGAANALNQIIERDYDSLMVRTAGRPIAAGRMSVSTALLIAGFMSLLGISLLALFNPLTSFLGMIALISYSFIYTPLKRKSRFAVAVGAFPGALPVIIGVTAAVGEINSLAIALFGIQFLWQFAHFWSIAWLADRDYKAAGFVLLPGKTGEKDSSVGFQSLVYSLLLIPFSLLPWIFGSVSLFAAIVAIAIAVWYCHRSWDLYKFCSDRAARKLMFASFVYLPLVLTVFLLDSNIMG